MAKIKNEENIIVNRYNQIFLDNIKQIRACSNLVYACRTQEGLKEQSIRCIREIEKTFQSAKENLNFYNETYEILKSQEIDSMLSELKEAYEFEDYVYMGDILEMQTIPMLYNMQSILRNVVTIYSQDKAYFEKNLNILEKSNPRLAEIIRSHSMENQEKYTLEFTNLGTISFSIQEDRTAYYIHSLNNPFEDGRAFAKRYFKSTIRQYIVYGFGFGYHIVMLSSQCKNAEIHIYECDLNVLYLAFTYQDLSEILENSNISIHYDPTFQELGEYLKDTEIGSKQKKRIVVYSPSLKLIPFPTVRALMEAMITQENIQEQAFPLLKDNFVNNIKHYHDVVDNLEKNFKGKNVFLIAAGPSLDKNVEKLKQINREKSIILATGTVFKKLLKKKIRPDYVIVLDPNSRVYKQIDGVESCMVPMIYLSTAYKGFARNYMGDKYIVLQQDFELSENLAEELGVNLYRTGGSVSTIALEVSIRLKAKRVIFLGLDLAYTDNLGHAKGTSQRERKEQTEYIEVKSVDGGKVLSSKIFCDFRKWIEQRIKNEKECEIIDATEGGAYIEGSKVLTMDKVIETFI